MSTDTQKPSEHAIRAAHRIIRNLYCSHESREADVLWIAEDIDQHAIAPAVADLQAEVARLKANIGCAREQRSTQYCAEVQGRDKRIAELEQSLAYFRSECINLNRKNIELVRGAPLERILSPKDPRVTDYTD